jgi:cyclase
LLLLNPMIRTLTVFVISFCFILSANCQDKPVAKEVCPGLYQVTDLSCNTAFLVTDSGVLVIDAGISCDEGRQLIASIQSVTDKPIRYLIFTHYHFDHVGGAHAFPKSTKIITQENFANNQESFGKKMLADFVDEMENEYKAYYERKTKIAENFRAQSQNEKADSVLAPVAFYRAYIDSMKNVQPVVPDITFKKEYKFELGNQHIILKNYGGTHSGCDCVVFFPDLHAVDVGDLCFGKSIPFIDGPSGGSMKNFIKTLDIIAGTKSLQTVLTGHGESDGTRGLFELKQLLTDLLTEVETAKKNGLDVEQTVKSVKLEKYKDLPGQDFLERDIRVVYQEL